MSWIDQARLRIANRKAASPSAADRIAEVERSIYEALGKNQFTRDIKRLPPYGVELVRVRHPNVARVHVGDGVQFDLLFDARYLESPFSGDYAEVISAY